MSIAFGGMVAFFFRGVNLAVALATVVFTTHLLSDDEYGLLVLSLSVIGLVNAATGGLTAATAYQIANQQRASGRAFAGAAGPAVLLGGLAAGIGLVASQSLGGDWGRVALPIGLAAAGVVLNSAVAGVFLGRNLMLRYNLALVAPPAFALIGIGVMFLAIDERTPEAGLAMFAAGQWAALAVLTLTARKTVFDGFALDRGLSGAVVRFAFVAGISSGLSYLNYRADLFVVDYFEGKSGAATYSRAVYLAESVWQVSGSLALATYARVGSLGREEAAELTARVMRHTVVMLGLICIVLFAAADVIAAFVFGDDGVASALRFILPGVFLYGLAQSFSGFYTYQRGFPWVSALVAGAGLILDMGFAFALVPTMGVDGASLASSLAYGLAISGALVIFMRSERLSPARILRFGREDLEDYRRLFRRLRALA